MINRIIHALYTYLRRIEKNIEHLFIIFLLSVDIWLIFLLFSPDWLVAGSLYQLLHRYSWFVVQPLIIITLVLTSFAAYYQTIIFQMIAICTNSILFFLLGLMLFSTYPLPSTAGIFIILAISTLILYFSLILKRE